MSLTYSNLSSLGTRDLFADLTNGLEQAETIVTPTVISSNPSLLEITNVAVNTTQIVDNGIVTEIGKGIHYSVASLVDDTRDTVSVTVSFVGSSGSKDTRVFYVPIVPIMTR